LILVGWLAADVEADVADGWLVGEKSWLAADVEADVADGWLVGGWGWLVGKQEVKRGAGAKNQD
jgi:hypothetical protein